MWGKTFIVLLWIIVSATSGHKKEISDYAFVKLNCICGIGENMEHKTIDWIRYPCEERENGELKCYGHSNPYQACANIACRFVAFNDTSLNMVKEKTTLSSFYPKELIVSKGVVRKGHRFRRESSPCDLFPLKNAEMRCWLWPNLVTCDISCTYGYAFETHTGTVNSTQVQCRMTENVWKPHAYKDCEPYVNCKVELKKPGSIFCKEPLDGPRYCDISCYEYETDDAVTLKTYECNDNNFGKTLPHCVGLNDTIRVVKKPK